MVYIIFAGRLLISSVFIFAAIGKLSDISGSRLAVQGFGIPERLANPLGTLLPCVELATGVALLFTGTAWWGAVGATALLICFVLAIGANLLRGRTPDCHCFGQLHSAPAGPKILMRNIGLAAVAAFLVERGSRNLGPGLQELFAALSGVQIAGLLVSLTAIWFCAICTWFMLQLYRQNGRLLERIEVLEQHASGLFIEAPMPALAEGPKIGLPPGAMAPEFELLDLHGQARTLQFLLSDRKPLMLLFVDPECGPCTAMLPDVALWHARYAALATIVTISRGTAKSNLERIGSHQLPNVLLQEDREVANAFKSYGTPGAVWVDTDGRIKSYVAQGSAEIQNLLLEQLKGTMPKLRLAPSTADFASEIVLPSLSGKQTKIADFKGAFLLLLFWNPSCGFCLPLLDDLRSWENNSFNSAPKLLVVSTGSEEANRQLGLRSEVVLDDDFLVGHAFNVAGTPSAVLLDERGAVAASLATGADAIRSLLASLAGRESSLSRVRTA